MNIYVGNLAKDVTEQDLRTAFEAFGKVTTVSVLKDRFTGDPRGFGFVEMPTNAEAQALKVNEARPKRDNRGGGGGFGGGGGRGGFGGGGRDRW